MQCVYRIDGYCKLSSAILSTIDVPAVIPCRDGPNESLEACSNCKCPNTYNYVVASLVYSHLGRIGLQKHPLRQELLITIKAGANCVIGGPGTELQRILKFIGVDVASEDACGCEWHARLMDQWGSDRCRTEKDKIAGWLLKSAQDRGWKARKWDKEVALLLVVLSCDLSDGQPWLIVVSRLAWLVATG